MGTSDLLSGMRALKSLIPCVSQCMNVVNAYVLLSQVQQQQKPAK